MKILPNIPYVLFLAKNVFWADTYAKGIDYLRGHNDPKSEKKLIEEVTDGWARRKFADRISARMITIFFIGIIVF